MKLIEVHSIYSYYHLEHNYYYSVKLKSSTSIQ
nr:MAG TPA: hypothetical protein [Caudoviricetes sp.]